MKRSTGADPRTRSRLSEDRGADGGTRTPTPLREQIFLTTSAFAAAIYGVRGLDYPFAIAVGRRRRPSSLYTFPSGAWLGIGLGGPLAFPEFERFYSAGFPAGTPMKSAASTLSPRPRWIFALTSCHSVHLRARTNSLASHVWRLLNGSWRSDDSGKCAHAALL